MAYKSLRVFKSPLLESFTHVNPLTPLLLFTPVVTYLGWRSLMWKENSFSQFFLWGALGLLVWTLVEYLLHRYAFHFPAKSDWGKRMVFIFHGLHHDDPKDPTRLVMPPLPAFLYSSLLYALFYTLIGPKHVDAFFCFFILGYLAYDYIHYGTHHFKPKTALGRFLRKHHLQHHSTYHNAKFGVSSPLWDYLFGTYR